jgi:hypothetical protein
MRSELDFMDNFPRGLSVLCALHHILRRSMASICISSGDLYLFSQRAACQEGGFWGRSFTVYLAVLDYDGGVKTITAIHVKDKIR